MIVDMMFIFSLPKDILYFLGRYFSISKEEQDEGIKGVFKFNPDWRNFLNTSQEYFGELKNHSQIVVLEGCYADKYLKSSQFRERILRTIITPLEQLELRCNFPTIPLTFSQEIKLATLNNLGRINKIAANQYRINDFPVHLNELTLQKCEIFNPENCPPLRSIHLEKCTLNGQKTIDVSLFRILEEASFNGMKIRNYRSLAHLKIVCIKNNDWISDVRCFRAVKKLTFNFCPRITDVSSLGKVHHLDLAYCDGITDVSSLGTVHKLCLGACENLTDVSALGNVPNLNLAGCTKLKDISCLRNVLELGLFWFSGNDDLSALEKVHKLSVTHYPQLSSIRMLKNIQELDITDCAKITDFKGLHSLKKLTIGSYWDGESDEDFQLPFHVTDGIEIIHNLKECVLNGIIFNGVNEQEVHKEGLTSETSTTTVLSFCHLKDIQKLTFHDCVFRSFPERVFDRLQCLTIHDCYEFTSLPELPSLGYLNIDRCQSLTHLRLSAPNSKYPLYSVKIFLCVALTGITVNRRINRMSIRNCDLLYQITIKNKVDHVRTESCSNLKHFDLSAATAAGVIEISPHGTGDCLPDYRNDDATDDDDM
jgi:hypothetical protein